ncbi:O-succinylbenzoic acid--CoA ligase [Rhodobium gokarnense]|uniref:O-succinylbenzoic acid--CoA ligase n=2 Tax=Rhodobium gokarnense TaxID=364296 RepID=A0ABT3HFE5_9HYPH|nr:O-succinylbenzoic acid--CoA ligase [Rhodobium gokarnense]
MLSDAGAAPGRPVAVVTTSAAAIAILAHTAPLLPVPLFPIDPSLPDNVIADLLDQAGVDLVVADRPFAGRTHIATADVLSAPAGAEVPWRAPDGIALLIATSGSSGRPKAVMLTGAALAAAAKASEAATPLGPGDVWLASLPLFHIGGFSILTRSALAGATALIHERFDAERVMESLKAGGVTHLSLVPAMLSRLCDREASPATLKHVLVGGAALSVDLAERAAGLGWPIQPTYGMSEAASQIATLASLPRPWRAGHVGPPLPGAEVALADDGRMKVRGGMLMAGYANPGLAPGDGLEDGWFVTADLAEIGPDGITVLGRADDVIVSAGKKVLPAMVEGLVSACPGIETVAVAGRPDAIWGEVVVAIYRGTALPEDVLSWCRENVASALRPRAALKVAAFPELANGKPDRSALKRLAASDDVETEAGTCGKD